MTPDQARLYVGYIPRIVGDLVAVGELVYGEHGQL